MGLKETLLMDESFSYVYQNLIEPFSRNGGKCLVAGSFLYNTLAGRDNSVSDLDIAVLDLGGFMEQAYDFQRKSEASRLFFGSSSAYSSGAPIRKPDSSGLPDHRPGDPSPIPDISSDPDKYPSHNPSDRAFGRDPSEVEMPDGSPVPRSEVSPVPNPAPSLIALPSGSSQSYAPTIKGVSPSGSGQSYAPKNFNQRTPIFYRGESGLRFVDILPIKSVEEYLWRVPLNIQSIIFDLHGEKLIGETGLESLKNRSISINNPERLDVSCRIKNCSAEDYMNKKGPRDFSRVA